MNGYSSLPSIPSVSSDEPDWSRERCHRFWEPGRKLLRSIRSNQACKRRFGRFASILSWWIVLRHRFWSIVTGADIPLNCQIEGGLLIPHPNGIVIHPDAIIGPNCLIFQQVTIGSGSIPGTPILEGHVDVGAGAKILGGIRIGAHAKIGANAVVVKDVPSGATVVGIPARVIPCTVLEVSADDTIMHRD
jgi:serine O-acetyltransferase